MKKIYGLVNARSTFAPVIGLSERKDSFAPRVKGKITSKSNLVERPVQSQSLSSRYLYLFGYKVGVYTRYTEIGLIILQAFYSFHG